MYSHENAVAQEMEYKRQRHNMLKKETAVKAVKEPFKKRDHSEDPYHSHKSEKPEHPPDVYGVLREKHFEKVAGNLSNVLKVLKIVPLRLLKKLFK